jgi:hypothetical protein
MATNDLMMALKMKVSFQLKNIYRFMAIVESVKNKKFHRNPAPSEDLGFLSFPGW